MNYKKIITAILLVSDGPVDQPRHPHDMTYEGQDAVFDDGA